ncbi:MAG: hypothetical protein GF388_08030 [Candidatus Aegiribacteria sp.]|nr:hypothetical protein [Candidatus Aegiribacteria sp.]
MGPVVSHRAKEGIIRYIIVAVLLITVPVALGQAITGFSGGTEYNSYYSSAAGDVVGFRFTVSEELEVSELGVWNNDTAGGGAGLSSSHEVGIWDDTETLLTSVTVDVTGTVIGDWTYASITPVLNPGVTYTAGALYTNTDNDNYISSASSATTDQAVTLENAVYPTGGELGYVYPALDSPTSSVGRFGPNFIFTPTPIVRSTWGSIKASMQ